MKKLLSLLLILVMIFSLLPLSALAAEEEITEEAVEETSVETTAEAIDAVAEATTERAMEKTTEESIEEATEDSPMSLDGDSDSISSGTCGDNLTWTFADGVITISGTGEMTSLTDFRFSDRAYVTCIVVDDGVTTIGNDAFHDCEALTSITIPDSVTIIGYSAFENCTALASITIPDSVTSIGYNAFRNCTSLVNITIPNSVTRIGGEAFYGCAALQSIDLPENIKSIGDLAFGRCTNLENITIPASAVDVGYGLFVVCSSLEYVAFAEGTMEIKSDPNMFYNCPAECITIPNTVTSIQLGAFKDCTTLKQFKVSAENQSYKSEDGILFSADGKTLISYPIGKTDACYTIPEGVEIVADYAFYHEDGYSAALKTIDICTGVEVIGDYAFYGLYLNSVSLPSGLLSIGEYAFGCNGSMERITIPASVTNIGAAAFVWCNELETINVEAENTVYTSVDGVLFNKEKTELCIYPTGKGADYGTYTVPKGVEKIWDHAFSRLTNVMIPDSVTTIGYESFTGGMVNPSMDIFYEGTEEQWKNIAVENPPLYDWNNPLERAVIHYEVDYSSVVAAGRCGDDVLWQLDTTGELTVYGSGATNGGTFFWCCAGYEDLIRSVTVCEGVSELGAMAFANCKNVERVTLSEGMTSIDFGLFENCYSLEAVVIPVSIVSIGDAFGDCTKLKEVYYTGTMEQWNSLEINAANESLFTATIICSDGTIEPSGNCGANLQWTLNTDGALTISGDGETYDYGTVYISGNDSFYYGSPSPWYGARGRITTVVIESGVTGIGKNAFAYCTALTDVYYNGTEAERNAISINSGNTPLTDATWHYGDTGTTVSAAVVTLGKTVDGDIVVKMTVDGKELVAGTDYSFTSTNTDGAISVTVTGCGEYVGTTTVTLDHTPGDIDGKDGVTILDVLTLLKAVAGITDEPPHADVNGDGDMTILDVLTLLKYVAGISGTTIY